MVPLGQAGGQQDSFYHATRVCNAFTRDVESGPVIDRGTDDWQSQRHVDSVPEREELHRDETLVVITRDDQVEFPAGGANENRVARKRTVDVDTLTPTALDGRHHDDFLFLPEETVFPGVRIQ